MRALTGVGPSMASGSHTWKGSCALFPIAPRRTNIIVTKRRVSPISPACTWWVISRMLKVPVASQKRMMPMRRPTSPTRVVMNAFLAASTAERRSQ